MSPLIIPLVTVKFKALIKKTSMNPAAHTQCGYCAAVHQALYNHRISTHLYVTTLSIVILYGVIIIKLVFVPG